MIYFFIFVGLVAEVEGFVVWGAGCRNSAGGGFMMLYVYLGG